MSNKKASTDDLRVQPLFLQKLLLLPADVPASVLNNLHDRLGNWPDGTYNQLLLLFA